MTTAAMRAWLPDNGFVTEKAGAINDWWHDRDTGTVRVTLEGGQICAPGSALVWDARFAHAPLALVTAFVLGAVAGI
jgi:hypothetical protein